MDFMKKVQEGLNKSLDVSRDLMIKAKDKVQELGEKGVLKIEIRQLEDQAEKLLGKLGAHVYESFEGGKKTLTRSEEVDSLIKEIETVKNQIEEKEGQLKQPSEEA